MNKPSKLVDYIFQSVKLLSSGVFVAVALVIIAKPKLLPINDEIRLFIIDYQLWQNLGITIIKVGVDQYIFAQGSTNKSFFFLKNKFLLRGQILNVLLCGVFFLLGNSYILSCILFFTLLFDLISIIYISENNVDARFNIVIVTNLIRNFSPYVLIGIFALLGSSITIYMVAVVVLSFSSIRFVTLFTYRKKIETNMMPVELKIQGAIIAQQLLNFLLFKIDNILISMIRQYDIPYFQEKDLFFLYSYQRFPDLVSGIITTISPLFFPVLYLQLNTTSDQIPKVDRNVFVFVCVCSCLLLVGAYFFLTFQYVVFNICHLFLLSFTSIFIFTSNYFTFEMIAKNKLKRLITYLSYSILLGTLLLIILIFIFNEISSSIVAIVPAQLFSFSLLCFIDKKNDR